MSGVTQVAVEAAARYRQAFPSAAVPMCMHYAMAAWPDWLAWEDWLADLSAALRRIDGVADKDPAAPAAPKPAITPVPPKLHRPQLTRRLARLNIDMPRMTDDAVLSAVANLLE